MNKTDLAVDAPLERGVRPLLESEAVMMAELMEESASNLQALLYGQKFDELKVRHNLPNELEGCAIRLREIPSLTDRLWNSEEVMSLNAKLGLTMDELLRLSRAILRA